MAVDPRKVGRKRIHPSDTNGQPVAVPSTSGDNRSTRAVATLKYTYTALNDVLQLYPLPRNENSKMVNIFGVIIRYKENTRDLFIKDETTEEFLVRLKIASPRPDAETSEFLGHLRPGDIIRIHRLTLYQNNWVRICPRLHNIVIFDSYSAKPQKRYLSERPTIEPYHEQRVKELITWDSRQLLQPKGTVVPRGRTTITNGAFVVLAVKKMCSSTEERHIIICLNGYPIPDFPCSKLFDKTDLLKTWHEVKDKEGFFCPFLANYLSRDFEKLYELGALFFLNTHGNHSDFAATLQPLDIIVVHNILLRTDYMFSDYSYLLFKGNDFGRALKRVDAGSTIGKMLQRQVWLYSHILRDPDYDIAGGAALYDQIANKVKLRFGDAWKSDGETDIDEEEFENRGAKKVLTFEYEPAA